MPRRLKVKSKSARGLLNVIDEIDSITALLRCLPELRRMEDLLRACENCHGKRDEQFAEAVIAIGSSDAVTAATIWRLERISGALTDVTTVQPAMSSRRVAHDRQRRRR